LRRADEMLKLVPAALVLVSLPFLAHGGESAYYAATNRQQVAVACEQFAKGAPRALWLRVTGCEVEYLGAGYRESNGRLDELFLPMRPPSQPAEAPVHLVIATADPQVLSIAGATIGNDRQPDQEAYVGMMRRVVGMLNASKEVEGYARSGVLERLQTRRALAGLTSPVAADVVTLDLRARPSFLRPSIEIGIGVTLLLVAVGWRRRSTAHVLDRPVDTAPAESMDARPSRRIPSAMLLNLGPAADAADLETAPPLGSRSEIRDRIVQVLGPGAVHDGHAIVNGPGWSLALDLGREDPVWTVTVEARGEGSTSALERLARETGWRIFIPKLGTFVNPQALTEVAPP
jgi:hypothetical protein